MHTRPWMQLAVPASGSRALHHPAPPDLTPLHERDGHRPRWKPHFATALSLVFLLTLISGPAAEIHVDCAQTQGAIRPLHGGNGGPLQYGGVLDLTEAFRAIAPPYLRLHDCHWPNPDVVDIHTIFPDPTADPHQAASYDFRRTDPYIEGIVRTGSRIVFRLGESIEHTPEKYHVHPPENVEAWAAVCIGIIRHYNEGWAEGSRHGIGYWEIWNEPENRPVMWTGTDDQYFELYRVTARAIKSRWPELKVGGPSLGYTGSVTDGKFTPGDFLLKFLEHCRQNDLPLDFLSWHLYTDDPAECAVRAQGLRETLDRHGFTATELHLNEWNYLPDNKWDPLMAEGQGAQRALWFGRIRGVEGAAFAASVLTHMQNSPVEVANYYAFTHHGFGLFDGEGLPHKPYYAFLAFQKLLSCADRVPVRVDSQTQRLTVLAGLSPDNKEVRLLLSNMANHERLIQVHLENLPWQGASRYELSLVNSTQNLEIVEEGTLEDILEVGDVLRPPSIALVRVWQEKPPR